MPKLPAPIARIAAHQDATLGVALAWLLGGPVLTLAGFYLGTIVGADHTVDLQTPDMVRGFYGAGIGALVGIIFALLVTIIYPRVVEADARANAHHHH